jgi:hypothetical protein
MAVRYGPERGSVPQLANSAKSKHGTINAKFFRNDDDPSKGAVTSRDRSKKRSRDDVECAGTMLVRYSFYPVNVKGFDQPPNETPIEHAAPHQHAAQKLASNRHLVRNRIGWLRRATAGFSKKGRSRA